MYEKMQRTKEKGKQERAMKEQKTTVIKGLWDLSEDLDRVVASLDEFVSLNIISES
ncbi:hypothetical protein RUM43_012107, partial [Polyplax serrata]